MKKAVLVAAMVGAIISVLTPSLASGASVVQCKSRVYPGANSPVYVTSVRGLTCTAAVREQRRYKWTGNNTFRTPGGYRCAPSGRGKVGYQIRCTKSTRAYRIEFED